MFSRLLGLLGLLTKRTGLRIHTWPSFVRNSKPLLMLYIAAGRVLPLRAVAAHERATAACERAMAVHERATAAHERATADCERSYGHQSYMSSASGSLKMRTAASVRTTASYERPNTRSWFLHRRGAGRPRHYLYQYQARRRRTPPSSSLVTPRALRFLISTS